MTEISKPTGLNIQWASAGDILDPGDTKYQTGWEIEIPPRQWENYIQNKQDKFNAHVNQHGVVVWDNETEYQTDKSYVQGTTNGIVYRCVLTHGGTPATSQDPELDVTNTYWDIAFVESGSTYTKTESDALYLAKAQNLADLPNVATARTNLSVYSKAEIDANFIQMSAPVYVTATDTIVHPVGYAHVKVELVGGGAGGGSAVGNSTQTVGAAGGGSGRFAESVLTAATVGASTLCTIGAGGAGGTAGGAGGVGGTTSFGAHVTAGGGASGEGAAAGSTLNVSNGGAGGTASTGADYASNGGPGGNGVTYGSASVNRGVAGDGGTSRFGGGGAGKALVGSDVYPGVAGGSPGAGGSGAGVGSSSGTTQVGGAGAAGIIRLTYYK